MLRDCEGVLRVCRMAKLGAVCIAINVFCVNFGLLF